MRRAFVWRFFGILLAVTLFSKLEEVHCETEPYIYPVRTTITTITTDFSSVPPSPENSYHVNKKRSISSSTNSIPEDFHRSRQAKAENLNSNGDENKASNLAYGIPSRPSLFDDRFSFPRKPLPPAVEKAPEIPPLPRDEKKTIFWRDVGSAELLFLDLEPVGKELESFQWFLCRSQDSEGNWLSGKLGLENNTDSAIGMVVYCGIPIWPPPQTKKFFQVLSAPRGTTSWIPSEKSKLPKNAIPSGTFQDGEIAYVCRAIHKENGGLVPGSYSEKNGTCYFAASVQLNEQDTFEILTMNAFGEVKGVTIERTEPPPPPPRPQFAITSPQWPLRDLPWINKNINFNTGV